MKLTHFIVWIFLLQALSLIAPEAMAQDAASALSGNCVPHTKEQGPWNCKVIKPPTIFCSQTEPWFLDRIWKTADSTDDANARLRMEYSKANDVLNFSRWFACQGFSVGMKSPANFLINHDNTLFLIGGSSPSKDPPFPIGWINYLMGWPRPVHFVITLDEFGQIKEIKHSYNFE